MQRVIHGRNTPRGTSTAAIAIFALDSRRINRRAIAPGKNNIHV